MSFFDKSWRRAQVVRSFIRAVVFSFRVAVGQIKNKLSSFCTQTQNVLQLRMRMSSEVECKFNAAHIALETAIGLWMF